MPTPKLVPGTLYFNRDRDYRSDEWGQYVKIGIVRHDRTAEERAKEHQTGNPREVKTTHQLQAPMVEHLETQLHHRFAVYWVNGEWFEMSQKFVVETVLPEAKRIIIEQSDFLADFKRMAELKALCSNDTMRRPTIEELEVWEHWKCAKEAKTLAENKKLLIDLDLRATVGDTGGIKGIVNLIAKPGKTTLNKKELEKQHADIYQSFLLSKEPSLKGSFLGKGALTIAKLDPNLAAVLKIAKAGKPTFTEAHVAPNVSLRTRSPAIKQKHEEFVQSLGALARADWDVERWGARLARMLGEDEELEKLVTWKRKLKAQNPVFDLKAFTTEYPDLCAQFSIEMPTTVSVDILFQRPYPL